MVKVYPIVYWPIVTQPTLLMYPIALSPYTLLHPLPLYRNPLYPCICQFSVQNINKTHVARNQIVSQPFVYGVIYISINNNASKNQLSGMEIWFIGAFFVYVYIITVCLPLPTIEDTIYCTYHRLRNSDG